MSALLMPLLLLALPDAHAQERVRGGNRLSKRAQLRYLDVVTEQGGTRWLGKLVERGEEYRLVLEDGSEIVLPQADVASVTRELHPGLLHTGQWGLRASVGGEVAFVLSETSPGLRPGPMLEFGLAYNFRGAFEPEVVAALSPVGDEPGAYAWQVGIGTRYYLNFSRRTKPFTYTQVIIYGAFQDLALRTGPGFMLDLGPNFGLGFSQGVTLVSQRDPDDAVGIGYHVLLTSQTRF